MRLDNQGIVAFSGYEPWDLNWRSAVERFLNLGLEVDDLLRFVDVVKRKGNSLDYTVRWRYLCGCCYKELEKRQDLAKRMIDEGMV